MYLRVGANQRMYARRSYTMLAYLGDLGGLLDIIWIIGAVLTAALTRDVLQAAMITNSYHVQKYNHDNSEYYPSEGGIDNH